VIANAGLTFVLQGEAVGRMVFVLFPDEAPRAAENYRQLFTGEKVRQACRAGADAESGLRTILVNC
jgi:hypothetical protein